MGTGIIPICTTITGGITMITAVIIITIHHITDLIMKPINIFQLPIEGAEVMPSKISMDLEAVREVPDPIICLKIILTAMGTVILNQNHTTILVGTM